MVIDLDETQAGFHPSNVTTPNDIGGADALTRGTNVPFLVQLCGTHWMARISGHQAKGVNSSA